MTIKKPLRPILYVLIYLANEQHDIRITCNSLLSSDPRAELRVTIISVVDIRDDAIGLLLETCANATYKYVGGTGFYKALSDQIGLNITGNYLIIRAGFSLAKNALNVLIQNTIETSRLTIASPISPGSPFLSVGYSKGDCINSVGHALQRIVTPSEEIFLTTGIGYDCVLITGQALKKVPFPNWTKEEDNSHMSLQRFYDAAYEKGSRVGVILSSFGASLIRHDISDPISFAENGTHKSRLEQEKQNAFKARTTLQEILDNNKRIFVGKLNICFVVQGIVNGGGFNVINTLANGFISAGHNVKVLAKNLSSNYKQEACMLYDPMYFSDVAHIEHEFHGSWTFIATLWSTVNDAIELANGPNLLHPSKYYFIQDNESRFYGNESEESLAYKEGALNSYCQPIDWVYTSDWIYNDVLNNDYKTYGLDFRPPRNATKIQVGVDILRLSSLKDDDLERHCTLKIGAMARPSTPRRGYPFLESLIKTCHNEKLDVSFHLFGEENLPGSLPSDMINLYGKIPNEKISKFYDDVDIFLDVSTFQGFGLCNLEAMARECVCITTDSGGIMEYCKDSINSYVAKENDEQSILDLIKFIAKNREIWAAVKKSARNTALSFDASRMISEWHSIVTDNNEATSAACSSKNIAIVIPVYNNIHVVKQCLRSVIPQLSDQDILIVVDDCSDEYNHLRLQEELANCSNSILIRNAKNEGFVKTANRGMKKAANIQANILLLNSDVELPCNALDRIRKGLIDTNYSAILCPLATSSSHFYFNVSPGETYKDADNWLLCNVDPKYPHVFTPEGWCMVIPSEIYKSIGFLDTIYGRGYCEESDWCLRAFYNGFELRLIDNLLVRHIGRVSFGEERSNLYVHNRKIFDSRWEQIYKHNYDTFLTNSFTMIEAARNAYNLASKYTLEARDFKASELCDDFPLFLDYYKRIVPKGPREWRGKQSNLSSNHNKDITFIVPELRPYGGIISVVDHINELWRSEVNVRIIVIKNTNVDKALEDTLIVAPIYINTLARLRRIAKNLNGWLVTTSWITAYYADFARSYNSKLRIASYVQDVEYRFHDTGTSDFLHYFACESLKIPEIIFCKTKYISNEIKAGQGIGLKLINPAVNTDIFYSSGINNKIVDISCMYRPETPQRGGDLLISILQHLLAMNKSITICLFGTDEFPSVLEPFSARITWKGVVAHSSTAEIYRSSKIFLETSVFHGFGRTIAEAMACGCVPVITDSGGPLEFCSHDYNSVILKERDPNCFCECINSLIGDNIQMANLATHAKETIANNFRASDAAERIKELLDC